MSSQVYVGKDVDVTIQIPVEEEDVSSQFTGTENTFTVAHTPISDGNQNGVSDEPCHVTVTVNGARKIPDAVNDSTGLVTLNFTPLATDTVLVSYRYDLAAYIAQEATVEPVAEVEGLDGLGSDKIQAWALLKKEFTGSIREVFREETQMERISPFSPITKHYVGEYPPQKILNPSVEDGTVNPDHWTAGGNGTSWDAVEAHTGSHSLKIEHATADSGEWQCDHFPVFAGRLYKFEAYVKGSITADEFFLTIRWFSDLGGTTFISEENIPIPIGTYLNWHVRGAVFQAPVNAKSADVKFRTINAVGAVNVDDFKVVQGRYYTGYHGIIAVEDDGEGHVVKLGLQDVVFPSGSLPLTKGGVVYVETPFTAQTAKNLS